MCGLAGFFSSTPFFDRGDLETMLSELHHRGPDATGFFTENSVGLGSKRLRIIDLSERANQPMHSASERYVAIYNGMVYNFNEIGAGLQGASRSAHKTSSDTEIVLEAFAQYGVDFVHKLNGMFAIAIYDRKLDELHIFRDRLGIKPLYYYWDGKKFAFASELKALRELTKIPKRINKRAIRDFLHLGYIPTPHSIYENIYKMNSGTRLKISKAGLEEVRYWDLQNCISADVVTDVEEALVKLSDLLISSIQYQLKSDVPYGILLSGGVDSSLIVAKAAGMMGVKPNTFTIGFSDIRNETTYAREIAALLGADHHEVMVSVQDAVKMVDALIDTFDEPFADSSAIPTMLVSKFAKEYITVTLSGEGGDELFMGYGTYRWAQRLNDPFMKMFRYPARFLLSRMPSRYQRVAKLLSYNGGSDLHSHIFSQEQYWFASHELDHLLTPEYRSKPPRPQFLPASRWDELTAKKSVYNNLARTLNPMEEQALFDLQFYLPDDLLTKTDRCSMHYSLEARVPFLDHRLVEYALNLSTDLKIRNGSPKYILKRILYKYLPKEVFDRPKEGFDIPLNKWLKNELKHLIDENLNETVLKKYGIVDVQEVRELLARYYGGSDYLYNRIWQLIVLHKWMQRYGG